MNHYCWKAQARFQVHKPFFRSKLEAANFKLNIDLNVAENAVFTEGGLFTPSEVELNQPPLLLVPLPFLLRAPTEIFQVILQTNLPRSCGCCRASSPLSLSLSPAGWGELPPLSPSPFCLEMVLRAAKCQDAILGGKDVQHASSTALKQPPCTSPIGTMYFLLKDKLSPIPINMSDNLKTILFLGGQ